MRVPIGFYSSLYCLFLYSFSAFFFFFFLFLLSFWGEPGHESSYEEATNIRTGPHMLFFSFFFCLSFSSVVSSTTMFVSCVPKTRKSSTCSLPRLSCAREVADHLLPDHRHIAPLALQGSYLFFYRCVFFSASLPACFGNRKTNQLFYIPCMYYVFFWLVGWFLLLLAAGGLFLITEELKLLARQ